MILIDNLLNFHLNMRNIKVLIFSLSVMIFVKDLWTPIGICIELNLFAEEKLI